MEAHGDLNKEHENKYEYFLYFQDFLQNFWPDLQAAHDLYGSISQSLQEKESESSQKEFSEHLPAEVLEAGIKSGRYIKVQEQVYDLLYDVQRMKKL